MNGGVFSPIVCECDMIENSSKPYKSLWFLWWDSHFDGMGRLSRYV